MDRKQFLKYLAGGSVVIAILPSIVLAGIEDKSLEEKLFPLYNEVNTKFKLDDGKCVLLIDGQNQKLYLVDGHDGFRINNRYDISTGKKGFGNLPGSGKTPTGIHRIKERHGAGAPIGTIFIARQDAGRAATIYTDKYDSRDDFVTSRIMWLEGCEEQNKNSHSRFIYIHGTPEEGLIGTPASHGCIRMKNKDVIELYKLIDSGTYVNIKEVI